MKNKWIIPVVLFVVLIITYVVRGMFQARVELEILSIDKIEEASTTQGVLIKKEIVNNLELTGSTEIYAKDGDRVANKEIIAMLYGDSEDKELKEELARINKKINAIRKSDADSSAFVTDTMQMETELSNFVDDIIAAVCANDLEGISEYKYKIQMIAAQKAIARGEDATTPAEEIIRLQTRKNEIEAIIGQSSNIIAADMAGIFTEGEDGYESELTVDTIGELSPDKISDVIKGSKNGNKINEGSVYTYKIIDNFSYYVAVNVEEEMVSGLEIGSSVIIRFNDFSSQDNKATVKYISEPNGKGVRTVVVECDNYVENLLTRRVVNIDFVKKSVSGYKVDVEHIHTVDNKIGLYIKRGAVMRFLPINIDYSNEEEAIVSSADASMPIKSYDEVVTSAPEYYDGRVIE